MTKFHQENLCLGSDFSVLADISEHLPGAVFQYTLFPDGTDHVKYMSKGCKEIWEIDIDDLIEDAGSLWEMIHEDDLEGFTAGVQKSYLNLSKWYDEWRIITPSGKLKWLRGYGMPHKSVNGDVTWNSVILDATAEVEASLKHAQGLHKTIDALVATLEMRDTYTAGHARNVARTATRIGKEIGLSAFQLEGLELGALVHDIGKIQTPIDILTKSTKLHDLEFDLIKLHPENGAKILGEIDFPWPVAKMVLQHHEHMNGKGYPHGIAGDEILIEARIIAVADTIDAIINNRPYRLALGLDFAKEVLTKGAGTQYDADAARIGVKLIEEGYLG